MISVNITSYNRPALLDRCLESFTPQHPLVSEIIVVDDCSSIDYSGVISKYEANLNLVYHRHSHNCGNAASRNTALKLSSGKYVSFMDDDDYAEPEKYDGLRQLFLDEVDFFIFAFYQYFGLFEFRIS